MRRVEEAEGTVAQVSVGWSGHLYLRKRAACLCNPEADRPAATGPARLRQSGFVALLRKVQAGPVPMSERPY